MSIFSRIRNRIESIFSYIIGEGRAKKITFSDIENELVEISNQQKVEREIVFNKTEKLSITELSPTQKKLIYKKCQVLNIRNSKTDFEKFRSINQDIEKLETNRLLQSKIKFQPKKNEDATLEKLFSELKDEKFNENILPSLSKKRQQIELNRKKNLEKNTVLKNEILNFSLIELHQKREEERKEQDRLEREKKINEQFESHLARAKHFQANNHFSRAENELLDALQLELDKEKEVQQLMSDLKLKKYEFKKRLAEFNEIFANAENSFHSGELEQAISQYNKALKFNIDNTKCERRISDANHKIQRIRELEEVRKRKEKEEKVSREKYKEDAEAILQYYKQNGIFELYHYTDSRNINSIIQNHGLYSLRELDKKGICYHQGSETREKPEYIRLSYTKNHPLLWISKQKRRIEREEILNIDVEVASLKETTFTNVNVARTSTPPIVKFGKNLEFIKKHVKLNVVKRQYSPSRDDRDHPYYQAEIMVKDQVKIKYIKNLSS